MTLYAKIFNNQVIEYPVTQQQIMKRYAHVSFVIDPFVPPPEYQPVIASEPPQGSYKLNVVEGIPQHDGICWTQTWLLNSAISYPLIVFLLVKRLFLFQKAMR